MNKIKRAYSTNILNKNCEHSECIVIYYNNSYKLLLDLIFMPKTLYEPAPDTREGTQGKRPVFFHSTDQFSWFRQGMVQTFPPSRPISEKMESRFLSAVRFNLPHSERDFPHNVLIVGNGAGDLNVYFVGTNYSPS